MANSSQEYVLYGYPDAIFYVIHYNALVFLSVSTICSVAVIASSIIKFRKKTPKLFNRLIVYLSLMDLIYSVIHGSDHILILTREDFPEILTCKIYGAITFAAVDMMIISSVLMSITTALSIVRQKQITMGSYDCFYILAVAAIPLAFSFFGHFLDIYGPAGVWCGLDMNHEKVGLYNIVFVLIPILVCQSINLVSYGVIFSYIKSIKKSLYSSTESGRHGGKRSRKNLRMVMLSILLSVFFTPLMMFCVWQSFAEPPAALLLSITIFSNSTGMVNAFAFSVIPRLTRKLKTVQSVTMTTREN